MQVFTNYHVVCLDSKAYLLQTGMYELTQLMSSRLMSLSGSASSLGPCELPLGKTVLCLYLD